MRLRQLRHVVTLAAEGKYDKAANRLDITQSALTRSIQSLERYLGFRLFDRGRSGTELTVAGRAFAREAVEILSRVDSLDANSRRLAQGLAGRIAFGCGPMAAAVLLPRLLTRMVAETPLIDARVRVASAPELMKGLFNRETEFIIVSRLLADTAGGPVTVKQVGSVQLAALVRRGHPLLERPIKAADFAAFPILGPISEEDSPIVSNRPTVACDDYGALRSVTMATDAVWLAADCLRGEELERVDFAFPGQGNRLVAVSLAGRTLSPAAERTLRCASRVLNGAGQR